MALQLTGTTFDAEVLQSDLPVLVDFYADWCGPCKMMGPVVDAVGTAYEGRLKVCKINVDEAQEIAARYGVMSIPTFIFFKNGEIAHKVTGALSKEAFEAEINRVLG